MPSHSSVELKACPAPPFLHRTFPQALGSLWIHDLKRLSLPMFLLHCALPFATIFFFYYAKLRSHYDNTNHCLQHIRNSNKMPWLVWLSGLSPGQWTKGSLVQFPVRADAWAVGQVPSKGPMRGNHTICFSPSLSPSLPLFLKINE